MNKKNKKRILTIVILSVLLITNISFSYGEDKTVNKNTSYLYIDPETTEMTYYLNGKVVYDIIIIMDKYIDSNMDVFFFDKVVLYAGVDGRLKEMNEIKNKMTKKAFRELKQKVTTNKSKSELQVGDSYFFGRYEQDDLKENGRERIEWIVMKKENDRMYLLSKKVLDYLDFDEKWIDEEFLKSFIDDELEQMFMIENKYVRLYDDKNFNYEKLGTYPSTYAYHKGIDVEKEKNDDYMNCSFKTSSNKIIGPSGKPIENYDKSDCGFRPMICISR